MDQNLEMSFKLHNQGNLERGSSRELKLEIQEIEQLLTIREQSGTVLFQETLEEILSGELHNFDNCDHDSCHSADDCHDDCRTNEDVKDEGIAEGTRVCDEIEEVIDELDARCDLGSNYVKDKIRERIQKVRNGY